MGGGTSSNSIKPVFGPPRARKEDGDDWRILSLESLIIIHKHEEKNILCSGVGVCGVSARVDVSAEVGVRKDGVSVNVDSVVVDFHPPIFIN